MPNGKWFANRGQIIQTAATLCSVVLSGTKAWPDMKNNEYFSTGAILFYLICTVMMGFVIVFIKVLLSSRTKRGLVVSDIMEPPGFDAVRHQYRQLPMDQKIALAVISKSSNLTFPDALRRLSEFQFSPQETLNRLLNNTKLVDMAIISNTVSIIPSVADSVREAIEREPPL
jgi:hypothetical protein